MLFSCFIFAMFIDDDDDDGTDGSMDKMFQILSMYRAVTYIYIYMHVFIMISECIIVPLHSNVPIDICFITYSGTAQTLHHHHTRYRFGHDKIESSRQGSHAALSRTYVYMYIYI